MKTPFFLTCLFVVFLTSCNGSSQDMEVTPPIPTATITPSPPIDQSDTFVTDIAKMIGTPIVASDECYETGRDPYSCANARLAEIQSQMAKLLPTIEAYYQQHFPEGRDARKEFQNFHTEWEDFSGRECKFRSHSGSAYWPQMITPINYAECMVSKYEDRQREYQIEIFGWTN